MDVLKKVSKEVDREVFRRIWDNGGEAFLVGGAVRDAFIGRDVNDLDFCITGFNSRGFDELFKDSQLVGNDFSVFLIDGHEFALAREECKIGNSRYDFDINDNNVSIEDDLERRDFTVNSLAINVRTGEFIDPFGGLDDIKEEVIRHTSDVFSEDVLRVYRAFRFAAQLGFDIEEDTLDKIKGLKDELSQLTVERVFTEMRKAINSDNPSNFFRGLGDAGLLDVHFLELDKLRNVPQPEKYHREGDAFNHSLLSLDVMSDMTDREELRFSALVHDLGKGETVEEEYPHHYLHEKLGVDSLFEMANRLKLPNDWVNSAKISIEEHMRGSKWMDMRPGKVVRLIDKINRSSLGLDGFSKIVVADKKARKLESDNSDVMDGFVEIGEDMFDEVNGNTVDYGDREGEEIGNLIFQRRAHWLKRERNNLK